MTNKAKTYLKNIQEADTEKKLIGIEIAFKQDMTLSCNDLGSLCRAAEDKRYRLRNNEETLKLKQILFFRTLISQLRGCYDWKPALHIALFCTCFFTEQIHVQLCFLFVL